MGLAPQALEARSRCWAQERDDVNPREEPSGKASQRQWCFNQALKSGEDVAQLRLADGIVYGGAARTEWWRQEKQVVPDVWCGMS